ncbi:GGDEF domain-containing protein [Sulfurimonas sp. SAG-AH-194-C21]|nr:GGDEF domain-containing protein [Sulfurimonas sp. SAG-AH-194-C21]MDF1883080.1 GGDEF domain-containing protein [Sulfurimonas sp. SAG-AH-194-C21]
MNIKTLLKNYFTADIIFSDTISYRRVVMINSMLSLCVVAFFLFAYLNIIVTQDYFIAALDLFTGLLSLFTLGLLRRDKNIQQAAFLSTIVLMTFMIVFITRNENSHFGIIWSIFIPYFAIMFNGKKLGLYISIFFYTIMFALAYKGLGIWSDGEWASIDLVRFTIASSLLTFIIYMTESAHEQADKELSLVRASEQKILQELTHLAITDELTGSYNRRHFNKTLPQFLDNAKNNNESVSFFILDIDYFKEYNDTYGHYAGDIVLKKVAQKLASLVENKGKLIFRIGGEEFAGVISMKDDTQAIINSINEQILELNIEHSSSKLPCKKLTVSVGVCTHCPSDEKQLEYFYKQADSALYKAKNSGRNTIATVE